MLARRVAIAMSSLLGSVAACGSQAAGPSACEVGPEIMSQSIAALQAAAPACASDAECVTLDTNLHCAAFDTGTCGTIMHRDAASKWDATEVCREIDDAVGPTKLGCSLEASCISVQPACVDHVCSGKPAL